VGQDVVPGRGDVSGPCLHWQVRDFLNENVYVVHRLDRPVSGVIVFARNADTHRFLCKAFEERLVKKTYWAAVKKRPPSPTGTIGLPLRVFGSGRSAPDPKGKTCETIYHRILDWDDGALLSVHPTTGRRHQIRAHLCAIGHPLWGDTLYGPPPRPVGGCARLLLHAHEIDLPTPAGERRILRSSAPDDFCAALAVVAGVEIVYRWQREDVQL